MRFLALALAHAWARERRRERLHPAIEGADPVHAGSGISGTTRGHPDSGVLPQRADPALTGSVERTAPTLPLPAPSGAALPGAEATALFPGRLVEQVATDSPVRGQTGPPVNPTPGSGEVALTRLLAAQIERAARQEALLGESVPPAVSQGGKLMAQQPFYGAGEPGPSTAEAAPALQAPPPAPWMPSWLVPGQGPSPGADSPPSWKGAVDAPGSQARLVPLSPGGASESFTGSRISGIQPQKRQIMGSPRVWGVPPRFTQKPDAGSIMTGGPTLTQAFATSAQARFPTLSRAHMEGVAEPLPGGEGPPEITSERFRQLLAQILEDDALRHGLNLKEG